VEWPLRDDGDSRGRRRKRRAEVPVEASHRHRDRGQGGQGANQKEDGMRSYRTGVTWLALMALVVALGGAAIAQEKQWWPFPVEDRDPPFNMEGKKIQNQYTPLAHAAKKWNI